MANSRQYTDEELIQRVWDVEEIKKIVQIGGTENPVSILSGFMEAFRRNGVMLIPNLTHQLFDHIFQGHNTLGAAEFIYNDGHVQLVLLQKLQQSGNFHGRGNELRRL